MNKILFIGFCASLMACTSNIERVDTGNVKQQMAEHKIIRITPNLINQSIEPLGDKLAANLTKELEKLAKKASKDELESLSLLIGIPFIDSLHKNTGFKIRLFDANDIQNKSLYEKEREVLDAYSYSIENKLAIDKNIQPIGDSLFVYTVPVPTQLGIDKLSKKQFCVWSIVIPKSEVIKSIK